MSNLSLHAIDQLYRSESEDPALILLTINFPTANNFYFVNNTENITSNGQEFEAFPFSFSLPQDDTNSTPELSIVISNVGLELVDDFKASLQDISVRLDLIFASNPDYLELSITDLIVKTANYSKEFINISIGYEDILNTSIPSDTYNASDYPGIFSV